MKQRIMPMVLNGFARVRLFAFSLVPYRSTHTGKPIALAALLAIMFSIDASGSTILIDQSPIQNQGYGSDAANQFSSADNFVIADPGAQLGTLTWYGFYGTQNTPGDPYNDSFTINIHSDVGGKPSSPLLNPLLLTASGTQADSRVKIGSIYEYTYDLSGLDLSAGTYWLEIFNSAPNSNVFWYWSTGDVDPVNGVSSSVSSNSAPGTIWFGPGFDDLAFTINAVPEPTSLALLFLGGGLLLRPIRKWRDC